MESTDKLDPTRPTDAILKYSNVYIIFAEAKGGGTGILAVNQYLKILWGRVNFSITHLNDFTNIKFYDPNQKIEML